jgi:hypothetical protein
VKQLADEHGADALVVVFGMNEPDRLRVLATTFRDGDPSYAGALGGIALGLPSYHVLELKDEVPADVWAREMGMKELEIEDALAERIRATLRAVRGD